MNIDKMYEDQQEDYCRDCQQVCFDSQRDALERDHQERIQELEADQVLLIAFAEAYKCSRDYQNRMGFTYAGDRDAKKRVREAFAAIAHLLPGEKGGVE